MDKSDIPTSYGVFKPVGHVVISFPSAQDMASAQQALQAMGVTGDAITTYTAQEMTQQAEADLERASSIASIGQELNLVKAHLALARLGYHFLVVEVDDDERALQVADAARAHRAERAQHYGSFVIEELIAHVDDEPQVAESPDKGLDAQTPSGLEEERAFRDRDPVAR